MTDLPNATGRTSEHCDAIARILVPIMAGTEKSVLMARSALTLGGAFDSVIALTADMEPEVREAARRMAHLAYQMVNEPSVLAILERVAKRSCDGPAMASDDALAVTAPRSG